MKDSANSENMKLGTVIKEKKELQKKISQLESTLKEQDSNSYQLLEQEKQKVSILFIVNIH